MDIKDMAWNRIRNIFHSVFSVIKREWSDVFPLPTSKIGKVTFIVLLMLGIFLRTWGLDWGLSYKQPIGPPHHDESHVINFLTIPWERFKAEFHEYEIVRPVFVWRLFARPMYALGERFGWNASENLVYEYTVPRAFNSFIGVIGLLVIYTLGVRLGGIRTGLLAMALLTVLPGHWYYSQLLKGDLLAAVFDSLLLLCAIRIRDKGTLFWYLLAGLTAGFGLAAKSSVMIMLPIVLFAHLWRAYTEKRLQTVFCRNAIITLISSVALFCLLYPYPFIDFTRWWHVLTAPTSQNFYINWALTPKTVLTSWKNYNEPPRLLMEMVFGEALRRVFPAMAVLFIVVTGFAVRAKQGAAYVLVALAALDMLRKD